MLNTKIIEVYEDNLTEALRTISNSLEQFNFMSIVTFKIIIGYGVPWHSLPQQNFF